MDFKPYADIQNLNGLKLSGTAEALIQVRSKEELQNALVEAYKLDLAPHPVGAGTNTIWGKNPLKRAIIEIRIMGFEVVKETPTETYIQIGAGENWDACVARSIGLGLSGIEALSAIPGTAGATPIQNVGAYGTDISKVLESVTVLDTTSKEFKILQNADCGFAYRDSIFKNESRGRYIIVDLTLRLSKSKPKIPDYKDIVLYFKEHDVHEPTLQEIRSVIQDIRAKKLPDPSVVPNCGSFFKNPIVDQRKADDLLSQFPLAPHYPDPKGMKLSAGWLIEQAGFKGQTLGRIQVYKNNALVLTAPEPGTTIEDVFSARDIITQKIQEMFDITLEMEPEIIS